MALEVLVDNRDGNVWEVPVSKLSWKTQKRGAGTLECTMINEEPLKNKVVSGAIVRVTEGKNKIFYGFNKKAGFGKSSEFVITAYDQIKYLKYSDTFIMPAMTAGAALKQIAGQYGLKLGIVAGTSVKMPAMVEDDTEALDLIMKYIDSTLVATNKSFILYDDFALYVYAILKI